MTQAFVSFWKQRHGCERCLLTPGKAMCAKCRRAALKRWHAYVATRLEKKLCIQCPRKHKPGEQRCQSCADANRANCISYYFAKRKDLIAQAVREGLCGMCHNKPSAPRRRNCRRCQNMANARGRGEKRAKRPYLCLAA